MTEIITPPSDPLCALSACAVKANQRNSATVMVIRKREGKNRVFMLQLSLRGTRKHWYKFPWCGARWHSVPDGAVGGVGVSGGNRADYGAHLRRLGDHHPADGHGENRRLVHVLHHQPDHGRVAERPLRSETSIHVFVRRFDFECVSRLCFKVKTLRAREREREDRMKHEKRKKEKQ